MQNPINQYTELFDANRTQIDAGSAPLINDRREQARRALDGATLPQKGDEGYEKTSIAEMFAPDYGININRMNIPVDIAATFRCDVPNISTLLAVVVNDKFVPTDSLLRNCPEGLTVMSLAAAANQFPELVKRYYGALAPIDDPAVALNTMLLQDGVFIHVAKGVKLPKAVQIVNIFSSPAPLLAPRRIVVALEEDAQLQLLVCDHTQTSKHKYLSSQVVEIFAGRNSSLDYYDIEESNAATARYSKLYAAQADGSNLLVNATTLSAGTTRNDFNITIDGQHCETKLAAMAIGSGDMLIDNSSLVTHANKHSHSDQLFKYVLDDNSTAAFEGSIVVTPQGQFTEAYQSNRNILASPHARVHTKPQLLIFNDDVKCSHGATTGQLDQAALFYMQTRGIPREQARTMLMQAFTADVIATVRLESLRDRLTHLVENRFAGRQSSCEACHNSCKSTQQ